LLVATTGRSDLLALGLKIVWVKLCNPFRRIKKTAKPGSLAGTAGSLVALGALLVWEWNSFTVAMVAVGSFFVGLFVTGPAAMWLLQRYGRCVRHDGTFTTFDFNQINWDEVHGMFVSVLPMYIAMDLGAPLTRWAQVSLLVITFIVFRFFDAYKVGLVKWAENYFKGALGVMADDTVAGLQTAMVMSMPFVVFGSIALMSIMFS
jgi:phosphatidylglycerophosphatase A